MRMGIGTGRAAAVLLLAGLALGAVAACDEKKPEGAAAPPAPPIAVLVTRAENRPVTQGAEFIGRLQALDRVEIRARVTGFLRERTFVEGQQVRAGDMIFQIEPEPFQAEVAAKQAHLQGAEATLHNAEIQVSRGRELIRTNAIPQSTLDQRIADQLVAQAEVAKAKAALDQVRIQLGYTNIVTPVTGRIGRATVTAGNVVGPDSGVLTTVVNDDPMRVLFPVTQRQLLVFKRAEAEGGAQAVVLRLRLPDGTMYGETGKISFINVTADASTDSTLVQGEIPNPRRLLTDGQVVSVVVETEKPREALVVPQSAVQVDQAGSFVLVVGADNKVEVKRVTLDRAPGGMVAVTGGLEAGAQVITEGAQRVRPGAVVSPRAAPPTPQPGAVPPRAG